MLLSSVKVKRIFIVVLIGILYFSGIAAIVYPMISNVVSLSDSKVAITDYVGTVKQMPEDSLSEKLRLAEKYNSDLADGIYKDGLERVLCDKSGIVCYVDIPTLDIYLPAYYGTSNDVLQKGAGCLENTSLPVGGSSTHSVISAHTGLPTAEMFTKLDQMEKGDVFFIHVLDKVLAYRVDKIDAVTPNKTELLRIEKGKDLCTLLTCTPYGINDKRLLVKGERIDYPFKEDDLVDKPIKAYNDSDAEKELDDNIKQQWLLIAGIIIASVAVYVIALVWLWLTSRKAVGRHMRVAEDDNGES